jgi:two-component system, LytTR family, sensor histidine kinase AgrC
MDLSMFDVVYAISDILLTYVIYKWMSIFFKARVTGRYTTFFSYALYYVVITFFYIFIHIPILMMLINLFMFGLISFNYNSSFKNRLFSIFMIYTILLCSESIIYILLELANFPLLKNYSSNSVAGLIFSDICNYIVVLVTSNYLNFRKGQIVNKAYWVSILLIPISSLTAIIVLFESVGISKLELLICIGAIFLINIFTFSLYDIIIESLEVKMNQKLFEQENIFYQNQIDLMKVSMETTKAFKHDLKNHLIAMKLFAKNNNKNELVDYVNNMEKALSNANYLANTGNNAFDSILNFKLQEAINNNVKVTLDLAIPDKLAFSSFDLVVLLGNLIDNAVQASLEVRTQSFIDVKIKYDKSRLIIKIKNSFNGIISNDGVELTSTKEDKYNRGFGINNVKTIVDKYHGVIDIVYNESIFSVTAILYQME